MYKYEALGFFLSTNYFLMNISFNSGHPKDHIDNPDYPDNYAGHDNEKGPCTLVDKACIQYLSCRHYNKSSWFWMSSELTLTVSIGS